jgi:hypothetical protein
MNTILPLIEALKPRPRPTREGWWLGRNPLGQYDTFYCDDNDIKYLAKRDRDGWQYWYCPGQENART